jgi:hypothetical protein
MSTAQEATAPGSQFHPIPITVNVGITGHRTLENAPRLRNCVDTVFSTLDALFLGSPHTYVLLSQLAEGADRLVTRTALDRSQTHSDPDVSYRCHALLPMPLDQFFATFVTETRDESVKEFQSFFNDDVESELLPGAPTREEAYEIAGRLMVDRCHLLIAIWDGRASQGRGGTADVIEYARKHRRAVFWIHSQTGRIHREERHCERFQDLLCLAEYNRERIDPSELSARCKKRLDKLVAGAAGCGLDPAILSPLTPQLLPEFERATYLASRVQKAYLRSGLLAYTLSALAVATAATIHLSDGEESLYWIEFFEILGIVLLTWKPRLNRLRRKWIDYRYLAERLRSACFLYLAGVESGPAEILADLRLASSPGGWIPLVHLHVAPAMLKLSSGTDYQKRSDFLSRAWILHQQEFYREASERNELAQERIEKVLYVLLGITLAAVVVHALALLPAEGWPSKALLWIALVFPAASAALAGISVYCHFQRNAERYHQMSDALEDLQRVLDRAPDLLAFQDTISKAEQLMGHEHQGWRFVVGVPVPGPG